MRRASSYSVADSKNDSENSEIPSDSTLKRYRRLRVSGKQSSDHSRDREAIEEHERDDTAAEMVTDFSSQKSARQDKGNTKKTALFSRRFSEPGKVVMSTGQLFRRSQSQVDQTMLNKQMLQKEGGTEVIVV